jgi:hypothetical protein
MSENPEVRQFSAGDLDRVLSSASFSRSERLSGFLRLLVERAIHHPEEGRIKETETPSFCMGGSRTTTPSWIPSCVWKPPGFARS